ncbi:hypothetical protein N9U05_00220 [bacterium]|nr:hypothetical protein [bacterium]
MLYDTVTQRPTEVQGNFDPQTGKCSGHGHGAHSDTNSHFVGESIQPKFDPETGEPIRHPPAADDGGMTVNLVLGKPSYSKAFGIVAKATRSEQDEDYVRAIELYFSASDMLKQLGKRLLSVLLVEELIPPSFPCSCRRAGQETGPANST